jgi:hypothetical protein
MAGSAYDDWEDDEIAATVRAYFELMDRDVSQGKQPRKPVFEGLHREFPERTVKAFEYKFQNISAALKGLGEPWLGGFAPASNAQLRLRHEVARVVRERKQGARTGGVEESSGGG